VCKTTKVLYLQNENHQNNNIMLDRRKFIKNAATATATLGLSSLAFSSRFSQSKKEKIGVALVGLGYYSTDLLAPALALTEHCYLAGIVTGSPEKAEKWKAKHKIPDKNIYNYKNFDSIADNDDIDVIYIVLPPFMHKEYVIRAANAGKHVWCEKPMAMTAEECEIMINACKESKRKLAIGYRMQHEPNTQDVIRFGKEKTYGEVQMISAAAGFSSNWKKWTDHWKLERDKGGGAMYDMGVYCLNAARYVTGQEPIAVFAQEFNNNPEKYQKSDMTTNFQLEFAGGVVANCTTSIGMNVNYLNVTATKGFYNLSPFQTYSGIKGVTSDGILEKVIPNQQTKQMDDNALSIINDTPMLVPGEEGMKDILVVEAIQKSAREGCRVVL
jgi:glucose-fructose oxidoreductase